MIRGTGNDIVALKAIDVARTHLPGFYSKILTPPEKSIYDDQVKDGFPFELFVWLLWSIKESVYKFLKSGNPSLVFSPSKILIRELDYPAEFVSKDLAAETERCNFDDKLSFKCIVKFGDQVLYSRSIISSEYIFSVVNGEYDFRNTYWGIKRIDSSEPAHQSEAARAFLLNKLNQFFPAEQLQITKDKNNIPFLVNSSEKMPVPVSIAHHDKYIAYSFQLDQ
jgi:phosphopantetheinyl transferase (holo-ACP synthase)